MTSTTRNNGAAKRTKKANGASAAPDVPELVGAPPGCARLLVYPPIWRGDIGDVLDAYGLELDVVEDEHGVERIAYVMRVRGSAVAARDWLGNLISVADGGMVRMLATPALTRLRVYVEQAEICHRMIVRCVAVPSLPVAKRLTIDLELAPTKRADVDPKYQAQAQARA